MDLDSFHLLLSPDGQAALQAAHAFAPREQEFLACFQALSRQFPAGLARAARLAERITFLQADLTVPHSTPTPFARLWAVEEWFPFQLKRLRSYLQGKPVVLVCQPLGV